MNLPTTSLSQRTEEIINFDKRIFFIFLVALFLSIRYLTNELILQSIPGFKTLEKEDSLTYFHIFNAFNYLWTPVGLIWKFTLTAFTLWIGGFVAGFKLPYRDLWKFTMTAEIIFIFPEMIRLLWYLGMEQAQNFQVIENFHPLSLFSLFDAEQVEKKYHYPLSALNLFEAVYMLVLAIGVHTISRRSFTSSLVVTLCSYTLFFLLWLVFYILVYK